MHHADRELELGTVAENQITQRPNLLIAGSGCGKFPDHLDRDSVACEQYKWEWQDSSAPNGSP